MKEVRVLLSLLLEWELLEGELLKLKNAQSKNQMYIEENLFGSLMKRYISEKLKCKQPTPLA